MTERTARARWKGGIKDGNGSFGVGSGRIEGAYSFGTRFEETPGTNPEELIAAAHASCFSMALAGNLGRAGYEPEQIETKATARLDKVEGGFAITRIDLETEAVVPGIDDATFQEQAKGAKEGCPVSRALAGVEIGLRAKLRS